MTGKIIKGIKAVDIMTKGVVTIDMEASAAEAVKIMKDRHISSLVIDEGDGEKYDAILTRGDILFLIAREKDLNSVTAGGEAVALSCAVKPDDDIVKISSIMTNCRASIVPVVEDGEIIGMISIGDILRAVAFELPEKNS